MRSKESMGPKTGYLHRSTSGRAGDKARVRPANITYTITDLESRFDETEQ